MAVYYGTYATKKKNGSENWAQVSLHLLKVSDLGIVLPVRGENINVWVDDTQVEGLIALKEQGRVFKDLKEGHNGFELSSDKVPKEWNLVVSPEMGFKIDTMLVDHEHRLVDGNGKAILRAGKEVRSPKAPNGKYAIKYWYSEFLPKTEAQIELLRHWQDIEAQKAAVMAAIAKLVEDDNANGVTSVD